MPMPRGTRHSNDNPQGNRIMSLRNGGGGITGLPERPGSAAPEQVKGALAGRMVTRGVARDLPGHCHHPGLPAAVRCGSQGSRHGTGRPRALRSG